MLADMTDMANKLDGYHDNARKDMLRYIPDNVKRTLEFGGGSGNFSALIKEKFGAEVWMVEVEKEPAMKAEKKLDKVIVADALESLKELPDNYFDCIIFFDVLGVLLDPYSLLHDVQKKLTKDGVIVCSIANMRYYRAFVKYVVHGTWDYKEHGILDKRHVRFFTYKSLVKVFNQLGLEITLIEGLHVTSSRTFRIVNFLLCNALFDVKLKNFAGVAKQKEIVCR